MSDADAFFAGLYASVVENPIAAVGGVIGCVILLRLAVLVAEEMPASAQPTSRMNGKSWWQQLFPSRLEQLAEQQDEIAARATFMRTKREEVLAQTDLLKAQNELDEELQAAKSKAPEMSDDHRMTREPSLTLPQIIGVLEISDLEPDAKRDLEMLFRQCFEDARPLQ